MAKKPVVVNRKNLPKRVLVTVERWDCGVPKHSHVKREHAAACLQSRREHMSRLQRLQRAADCLRLLLTTDKTVAEVAEEVGVSRENVLKSIRGLIRWVRAEGVAGGGPLASPWPGRTWSVAMLRASWARQEVLFYLSQADEMLVKAKWWEGS